MAGATTRIADRTAVQRLCPNRVHPRRLPIYGEGQVAVARVTRMIGLMACGRQCEAAPGLGWVPAGRVAFDAGIRPVLGGEMLRLPQPDNVEIRS